MHRLANAGLALLAGAALGLVSCATPGSGGAPAALPSAPATTFSVADADLPDPLVLVTYGDTRFTDPAETEATLPAVRQALVAQIAAEHPAAVFLNGDLPLRGIAADYAQFTAETGAWRAQQLRLYPALGNHEFARCEEADCLERWWQAIPVLRGHRWYSVALGSRVVAIMLDSDTSLLPGSEQRAWLVAQVAALRPSVRFVMIVLHHPPVADPMSGKLANHNARPNEVSLAAYLAQVAPRSRARFLVSAGHVHNYERFLQDGVVYLVSGGGGARPYQVDRGATDLYAGPGFPNFHYVRLEVHGETMRGEMMRLADYATAAPGQWQSQDRFELHAPP